MRELDANDLSVAVRRETEKAAARHGRNPLGFIWLLDSADNSSLNFEAQNEKWKSVRAESWHSVDLDQYRLWAISDNGDLFWWNGEQTLVMAPRDREFFSVGVAPDQFLSLRKSGRFSSFFPDDLLE